MNRLLAVLLFPVLCVPGAFAQSSSEATIQSLLAEVKLLRLALEKSALVTPKIQLTLGRIQLQQNSISRAAQDLEEVRRQVAKSAAEDAGIAGHISEVEARAARELDANRRREMEGEVKLMKVELERQRFADTPLRARESELVGRLQFEQGKLRELEDRVNAFEKMLEEPHR